MTDGIAAYVGVDWASVTHYAFALDPEGGKLGYKGFAHSGDGLAELVDWIRRTTSVEPHRVAIGIEVPHGPVVESLMEAGFQVYALNPKQLDRFRDRFTVAGAKDDRRDALVLADALRTDRQAYRLLEPMHPTIVELREWSRMTEDLSAERNRLANRFRHQLWRYFPQVLDLAEDWASLWILDLWDLIPTPARAGALAQAETLATAVGLDMAGTWTATAASYFSRVAKARVLEAVTEAVNPEEAGRIAGFRKDDMAEAAERLVEGRGWLPSVLRTQAGVPAEAQEAGEGADDETRTAPNDDAYPPVSHFRRGVAVFAL